MTKFYWTSACAALAGVLVAGSASAEAPRKAGVAAFYPLFADINSDCVVDKADVSRIRNLVGTKIKFERGDLDGDGRIGKADYYLAYASMGSTCGSRLIGDVDGSGVVNTQDLSQVIADYGTSSAASDINDDGKVTWAIMAMSPARGDDGYVCTRAKYCLHLKITHHC